MKLVIVESPTKARAIGQYLGEDYKVLASRGHIREIRHNPFGVDIDNNFDTSYEFADGAAAIVADIKSAARSAEKIYIASDPDREGEAIAWHLCDVLGIDPETPCRISYQEVNKNAVINALNNPRPLDMNLVNAAKARSIMDYIVGFTISPLLQRKYCNGLSAGRVQSAALYLICQREAQRLIELQANAEPTHYTIRAKAHFAGKEFDIESRNFDKFAAERALAVVSGKPYQLTEIKESKEKKSKPDAPFKTSTLIRASMTNLGFDSDQTMSLAQALFEGKSIDGESHGLITYMRTDSVNIAAEFQKKTIEFIGNKFGESYLPENIPEYHASANAQEAHEAIRPTDLSLTPETVEQFLDENEYKLYKLIYGRYLASQMASSISKSVSYYFDNSGYTFSCSKPQIIFDGYKAVYDYSKKSEVPDMNVGDLIEDAKSEIKAHYKECVPHFNQASLVEYMENCGIGRPSTYASTIKKVKERGYVEQEGKALQTRNLGEIINDALQEYFPDKFSVVKNPDGSYSSFTADMEKDLDLVANGNLDWLELLNKFWVQYYPILTAAKENMPKWNGQYSEKYCPNCGGRLIKRLSKSGVFYGCDNYPACSYASDILEYSDKKCPSCGNLMVKKHKKNGIVYYECVTDGCPNNNHENTVADPMPERMQRPWVNNINISARNISLTKLGNKIERAGKEAGIFTGNFNSQTLNYKLERNGLLEYRKDNYGNDRYLPTEAGIEIGLGVEERDYPTNPQGKMQITVAGRDAQKYIIEHVL